MHYTDNIERNSLYLLAKKNLCRFLYVVTNTEINTNRSCERSIHNAP